MEYDVSRPAMIQSLMALEMQQGGFSPADFWSAVSRHRVEMPCSIGLCRAEMKSLLKARRRCVDGLFEEDSAGLISTT